MTLGPLGNTAGLSGANNDAASNLRWAKADQKAEKAEGLGATEADSETSDRDANGRRLWEVVAPEDENKEEEPNQEHGPQNPSTQSKDPTGESGGLLDLTG